MLLLSKSKKVWLERLFLTMMRFQDAVMTWLREQAGDFYDAGI
jgi:hypothetical protein